MSKTSQTIIITGATSGIGRHAAVHLAAAGHHVIATGRKLEALAELRQERVSGRLDTLVLDVTSGESIDAAAAEIARLTEGRGVDALINNAGYGHAGPLADVTDEELRAQFETNVFGLMRVTRAFLPQLLASGRENGRARILNVSSVGGRVTFPMFGAYHASKYAVEALSNALRLELAPFGVDVVLIEPGPIHSEFAERSVAIVDGYARRGDSRYAPIFARTAKIKELTDRQSVGPEATSKVMERALYVRRPRARYVVPFTSRLMLFFLGVLPTRLADALMRVAIGLTPRVLGVNRALSSATGVAG
jgi:NAD(P)-dependent dehydrogenase (short-subunit alcohol dehydrogenase family)